MSKFPVGVTVCKLAKGISRLVDIFYTLYNQYYMLLIFYKKSNLIHAQCCKHMSKEGSKAPSSSSFSFCNMS